MADAGAGGDAGDRGVLDTGVDEARAASGNQQIHIAIGGHEGGGRGPGGVLDQIHRIFRHTHGGEALFQGGDDGVGRCKGLLAAAQDAHGTGLQGQGGGIGGDIGPGLIDDGDDAHGHGDFVDLQTVGPGVPLQQMAHGIGQGGDFPDALGHTGDPVGGEQEPVQHHLGHLAGGVFNVHGVCGQNGLLVVQQSLGHGLQSRVLLVGGQRGDGEFCRLCGFQHSFHKVTSPKSVPMGFPSKMS